MLCYVCLYRIQCFVCTQLSCSFVLGYLTCVRAKGPDLVAVRVLRLCAVLLVCPCSHDMKPQYFIFGGLVFTSLSYFYLRAVYGEMRTHACSDWKRTSWHGWSVWNAYVVTLMFGTRTSCTPACMHISCQACLGMCVCMCECVCVCDCGMQAATGHTRPQSSCVRGHWQVDWRRRDKKWSYCLR